MPKVIIERLTRKRRCLKQMISEIEQMISEKLEKIEKQPTIRNICESTKAAQSEIQRHFADEEEPGGVFHKIADIHPHLEKQFEQFRSQHLSLNEEISELSKEMERVIAEESAILHSLSEQVREFRRKLFEHEETENDFVIEAFHRDLGELD